MRYHLFSLLSVIATVPLAGLTTPPAPHWDDMCLKHAWNTIPAGWESLGPPPSGTTIDLHVALKPHNENALVDALYQVSSPGHPRYGLHLSKEEVAKLVAPHTDTLKMVHSWLEHHGVPSSSVSTSHGGGWLTLTGIPVSQANEMLGASYQLHQHAGTNDGTVLRTVSYALPAVLHPHVQTIVPTTYFGPMRTLRQTPHPFVGAAAEQENVGSREPETVMLGRAGKVVTPTTLRWLYKTFAYTPAATHRNGLGIGGYKNEYPSQTDLTTFLRLFRSEAVDATYTVEQINGGEYNPHQPGEEANLDMQYAQVIAYPTRHIYYSTGGQAHWTGPKSQPAADDAWFAWLNYLLKEIYIPQTITTSYSVDEKGIPVEYARTMCDLFAQLGARGVSVLFASGDDGVGAGDCKVKGDSGKVRFIPEFPASCPYVTSVGGTTEIFPEIAANLSGGGFSNYFSRPDYQKDVVPKFLKRLGRKYKGLYNANGRGIPDISAQAVDLMILIGRKSRYMKGTSCAAPTVAGVISLLNDFLISEGKEPLGFLNPWLYSDGIRGLNDITSGSNPGCGTDGFPSVAGWDPATGLGNAGLFRITGGTL
ncbi:subtilisin-like protein [Lactarius psammicola]|nr:subtilisin-like protein [Lactarius psammicola]